MTEQQIIASAVADPSKGMAPLVEAARTSIREGSPWATSLAYAVLGLSIEHALTSPAHVDILDWLLARPGTLSIAITQKVQRFAEAIGDRDLHARAAEAERNLAG